MNHSFWESRWHKGQTGWHLQRVHPRLIEFWPQLEIPDDATVLVPLCGKSLDLNWLSQRHHRVIGVEWIEQPILNLMEQREQDYKIEQKNGLLVYISNTLELWNGNFLEIDADLFPAVDAIYDRGSMVSFPLDERKLYARQIRSLAHESTRILLIVFEYDQSEMDGPPFSIGRREIETLYSQHFEIEILQRESIFDQVEKFQQKGLSTYMDLVVYHLH